jgi:hypothetical protein
VVQPGFYGSASIDGAKKFLSNRFKGEEIKDALQKIFFFLN